MTSRVLVAALCFGFFAVASSPVGAQTSTISVVLPVRAAAAQNRVLNAFVANGLVVDQAQGPVVRSAPYRFNPATLLVLTANLLEHDSTTTIILSGSFSTPSLGIKDEPLTESTSHLKGQLWSFLDKVSRGISPDSTRSAR